MNRSPKLSTENLQTEKILTPLTAQTGRLRLSDICKSYGAVKALRGISLDVEAGEFVALLGPSGCGKTTLLGAIAGFVAIDDGVVEIDGNRLPKNTPAYERNLGVVFQHYALFPHMTVRRNISFPLEIRGVPPRETDVLVAKSIEMVDLGAFQERFPAELSGGQQQRVALARALVYSPPILLLDEPLGALDRRLRDVMQAELMDLHRRLGKTFVYVTHDQDEALAMADRVVVMRNGIIEQQGAPLHLYHNPCNEFVAKFVGECNVLVGRWEQRGKSWVLVEPKTGLILHQSTGSAQPSLASSVAIRPEWIYVGDSAGLVDPFVSGELRCNITQMRFHGSDTLVNLHSDLGDLLVRIPHRMRSRTDLSQSVLTISWNPTESVVLGS